jgi:hypothetical protein
LLVAWRECRSVSGTTASSTHAAVDGTNPDFLGTGVHGVGGEAGVHGESNTWGVRGVGTRANAGSVGVLAQAGETGALALQVQGPAVFSRSGVLTVAAGKSSATVTGVALTAASLVLVTLQQHAPGVYVLAAVPNVSASSFTVYLSKAVTAAAKVAWFVVN